MLANATLPAEPASAGAARRFVRSTLREWRLGVFEEIACLLVSELVTNAVLHANSVSVVSIYFDAETLRVEVRDASPASVQPRSYSPEAGTGRGLLLVQALAALWGSSSDSEGKRVWFELDAAALSRGER